MYCASCGSAVPASVSYCNRCGAKVGAKGEGAGAWSSLSPNLIVCAMAVVFFPGIAAFFAMLMLMKNGAGGFDPIIFVAAALTFLLLVGVELALFWLLVSGRREARKAAAAASSKEHAAQSLAGANTHSLPEPASSVTEHTTRTFDPLPVERRTPSS